MNRPASNKELIAVFEYLEREKGIKREIIVSAIEEALVGAAKKGGNALYITAKVDPKTGEIAMHCEKEVVSVVEYPEEEISLSDARVLYPSAKLGQTVQLTIFPENLGRIAAQVTGQLMNQKIKSAERDVIYEAYRHRILDLVSGTVKRVNYGNVIVDLGKVQGLMPFREYPKTEQYVVGDRVLALLLRVQDTEQGGAEVILSRSSPDFVRQLLAQEVPELVDGTVEIKKICRRAGYRTKIAVVSHSPKVDPVGACVGVRGARINNALRELGGERIHLFHYNEDPVQLLKNALHPIEIKAIAVHEDEGVIAFVVDDAAYPNVIGSHRGNLLLIEELLDYQLEVKKFTEYSREYHQMLEEERTAVASSDDPSLEEKIDFEGVGVLVKESLLRNGITTWRALLSITPEELSELANVSLETGDAIMKQLRQKRKES